MALPSFWRIAGDSSPASAGSEHAAAAHRYRAISASPDTIVRPQARSVRPAPDQGRRKTRQRQELTDDVGVAGYGERMPGGWNETCAPRSVPSLRGARRGDESRRHSWIAAGAGAPSRRRVAVRRGGFMRWGRPRRWAIHTGPATSPPSRARRPANPVRRPGAKVKVSCAWWSGSVWAAAVAFAVLGTGCAPDATAPGETGIVRPGNSHRDRLARKLPPARPSRRRRKAPQSSR
jgi:hypothetical protein